MSFDVLAGKYRVFLIVACVNLLTFCIGSNLGWTSPVLPKLRELNSDNPLSAKLSYAQEGWIGSLPLLGTVLVAFFVGSMTTSIGRKWSLLFFSVFMILSYIILILATNVWWIYVARLFQGIGGGSIPVIPMYIAEIATDDTRGPMISLVTIFVLGGILFAYIIGPQVSYWTFQYCSMTIPMLFFAIFVFMPESPYYFAIEGRKTSLLNSLKVLRGKSETEVEDERLKIQKEVDESMKNKSRIIDILSNKIYRKALLIVCGLLFFQQMTGATAVTFNSQSIFMNAGSTLDPAMATIILGVVQLISNLLTPFVIERAGRKKILIVSAIGMGIALTALGVFFFVQAFGNSSKILWLPIPALVMYNIFFGFGFGPIPWAMVGEMFPPNIKSTATSMVNFFTCFVIFVVTRWFPELNALGPYYAFWLFGGCSFLGSIFVYFFVIETKGLSLQMIQEKLKSSLA